MSGVLVDTSLWIDHYWNYNAPLVEVSTKAWRSPRDGFPDNDMP